MRFFSRNHIFHRSYWDSKYSKGVAFLRSYARFRETKSQQGFTQKDYALRNAGWSMSMYLSRGAVHGYTDLIPSFSQPQEKKYVAPVEELTSAIRTAGKKLGIHEIGFTKTNHEFHYADKFDQYNPSRKLPPPKLEGLDNCIVIAVSVDYDPLKTTPSAITGVDAGGGYSLCTTQGLSLVDFIHGLGYNAILSLNDTALCIPYAIEAGLGEYGRNGLLINETYGPRFRIAKIFTDIPVTHDSPKKHGVEEFCNNCNNCSSSCPAKAIPDGPPSVNIHNISNIQGVKKWTVDAEKCYNFWLNINTECGICIRTCPFNKDLDKFWHRMYVKIIFNPLRKLKLYKTLLKIEKSIGFDKRVKPKKWWESETFKK
jgi:epoxyqueuosine reductase